MSQGSVILPVVGVVSGLTLANDINAAFDALRTMNSGGSAPSADTPEEGEYWLDTSTTPKTIRLYDGSSWVVVGWLDDVNHVFIPVEGGGTDVIASVAGITDLWSKTQTYLTVSGALAITQLANASAVAGTIKIVKATGAFTLTYDAAKLITPTGASITVAVGDIFIVLALTSTNVAIFGYSPTTQAAATAAMFNKQVTYAKMQDISVTARILMRKSAGAGSPEEGTASDALDFISTATGSIIYRSSTGWIPLAPSTALSYLKSTGGAPSWVAGSPALTQSFTSTQRSVATWAGSTSLNIPHGMGLKPKITELHLVNTSSEFGFSVGDDLVINPNQQDTNGAGARGVATTVDATNINIFISANGFSIVGKTPSFVGVITNASWNFYVNSFA